MFEHSSREGEAGGAAVNKASVSDACGARGALSWRGWMVVLGMCAVVFSSVVAIAYVTAFQAPRAHRGNEQITRVQRASPADQFDLTRLTIPRDALLPGGPPKDGIPALSSPKLLTVKDATYLRPSDRVIGVARGGEARAYPLRILNYHEIVNDRVGDQPVAVTYCPLCDSAAVFDRRTPLGEKEFGVSGLLYNSNVLMYDRSRGADSLWSQMKTKGVSGAAAGRGLTPVPLELTTWGEWAARHPHTTVMSTATGHKRNYGRDPYGGYRERPQLVFPAEPTSDRLPTKELVLGVWTADTARAYPRSAFSRERTVARDEIDGRKIAIAFNPQTGTLRVESADDGLHWVYSLWFAWYAFHPETTVYGGGPWAGG